MRFLPDSHSAYCLPSTSRCGRLGALVADFCYSSRDQSAEDAAVDYGGDWRNGCDGRGAGAGFGRGYHGEDDLEMDFLDKRTDRRCLARPHHHRMAEAKPIAPDSKTINQGLGFSGELPNHCGIRSGCLFLPASRHNTKHMAKRYLSRSNTCRFTLLDPSLRLGSNRRTLLGELHPHHVSPPAH